MITIQTTIDDIATRLGLPRTYAEEVVSRLFLPTRPAPLPDGFRLNLAEEPSEYSGQITLSSVYLTVQKRGWLETKIKDVVTLLDYIDESAKSLLDRSVWENYTGPKAPEATGESFETVWVRHYSLPGIHAVYPPSGPAE